jgi:hypothetical protein
MLSKIDGISISLLHEFVASGFVISVSVICPTVIIGFFYYYNIINIDNGQSTTPNRAPVELPP